MTDMLVSEVGVVSSAASNVAAAIASGSWVRAAVWAPAAGMRGLTPAACCTWPPAAVVVAGGCSAELWRPGEVEPSESASPADTHALMGAPVGIEAGVWSEPACESGEWGAVASPAAARFARSPTSV